MNKNLSIVSQNNKLMLKKSKSLMSITNSVLSNDDWMQCLWDWADQNDISDLEWVTEDDYVYPRGIPRDQKELLNLMELSLSACKLHEISKEIGNLVNLRELWLDDNKLLKVPKIIGNLYDLEFFTLNGNQLSTIPKEIGKLKNLRTLILSSNELNTIPKEIGNLHSLTSLFLARNKLIDMPIEIGKLTNLTMLYIYKNKLRDIPKEIGNLKDLTVLVLFSNELKKIPKEIAYLRNLTQLSLSHNQLTHIPQEVGKLDGLIKLSLAFNRIIELPKEITNLTLLTELHIDENPNLILSIDQKDWIYELIENGCDVQIDDRYQNLYEEVELERRYDYLDEFNIGRELPITPEMLDTEIPPRITKKLAKSEVTFEEFLDEVSEYLEYLDQENLNNRAQKIFDRDSELESCYEHNMSTDARNHDLDGDDELQRRYDYLDEFNEGREVPITPELLDDDIPPRITNKLAKGEITFEKYLDEVSEYLEYLDKGKYNNLVQKIYDRDYDLGSCFERNISFVSYVNNKLTWTSTAIGEDKKLLITHWGVINMFVKDTFGFETKIINIAVSVE